MIDTLFADALHASGPAPDRADKMALYGWLVGRWATEIVAHEPNGARHAGRGEIYAGWVLEGRAIQDVWMIPPRAERASAVAVMPVTGNWYGTTLRVYDPGLDVWHILWSDPTKAFFSRQIGRARGADIVQEGALETGLRTRWSFTEIAPSSFRWTGEISPDGHDWRLQVEVSARRLSA
ncbi:MAG TPA: hypothetical protein VNO21_22150 [Polyangiaceae bacterium]|nr:hypothetical protein [Polyangiaceae bacterium]